MTNSIPPRRFNGLGLGALIVGIIAMLGALVPVFNFITGFIAFAGIVMGVIALILKNRARGFAIAGTIVSFIALILSIVLAIVYAQWAAQIFNNDPGPATTPPAATPTEPATTDEPGDPGASGDGSQEAPVSFGTVVEIGTFQGVTYEVVVEDPRFDATEEVLAADDSNQAPADGRQYVVIPVTVTYVGETSGTPVLDLRVRFVADSGTVYRDTDTAALAPEPRFQGVELQPGETATGHAVLLIDDIDASGGMWEVAVNFGDSVFYR